MFGQCDVSLGLECKRPENGTSGISSCQCIEEDHFGRCKTNIINGKSNIVIRRDNRCNLSRVDKSSQFSTRFDTNQAVEQQKMTKGS